MARLLRRVGRRGAFLSFLALLDLLYGYSLLVTPAAAEKQYSLILPIQTWGWLWIACGALCLAQAAATHDRLGFSAAAVLKASWAALWAHLWIVQGFPRGWVSVVIWAAFAGVVIMVSGWPEPGRLP